MKTDLTSTTQIDFLNILNTTVSAYQNNSKLPSGEDVVNALLAAEKAAKQEKINYSFDSLNGRWRLCFATGTKKVRQRGELF